MLILYKNDKCQICVIYENLDCLGTNSNNCKQYMEKMNVERNLYFRPVIQQVSHFDKRKGGRNQCCA